MTDLVIEGCAVATVDGAGTEYADGHVVVRDGAIAAVGAGPAPADTPGRRVRAPGHLATPGLVNTHHHLYQWLTQGRVPEATLFEWLTALYPVWRHVDAAMTGAAAAAGLAWLARSGATTVADHPYLFPPGSGDLVAAEVAAGAEVGVRLHLCRGSMDLGESRGGLPPDDVTEDLGVAIAASAAAIEAHHDPAPDSFLRLAVGPCSPFSSTSELMRESAALARAYGVRLHTHLAETVEEDEFCRERFDLSPADYVAELGWSGADVWFAHAVHLDEAAIRRFGAEGTGVAHCPTSNARLGAGIAGVPELLRAGAPVGLGVDGAASSEGTRLAGEMHQALLMARARGGPRALTARQALELATLGGARCLGRDAELGSLEPGKQADIALWRLDGPGHAAIADPVTALVFGPPAPLTLLLAGGRTLVEDDELRTADEAKLLSAALAARGRLEGAA
ncbi:MAG: 8-oxoguanine deaminase [Streptosporangiales bacterium]|nr:8-oxoguanine deaminase [Streptosporangiales bacterium]